MRIVSALVSCLLALMLTITPVWSQSIEDMAGQMVLVGFQGATTDDAGFRAVREQVARGQIGGVMYLRTNVSSLGQVRAMNDNLQAARPWLAPFITIDQEGGQIRRLTRAVGFAETASAESIAGQGAVAAGEIYADLGRRLSEQGFNVNFGPVVDLNLNRQNPIIARYQRSFGVDPARVAQLAAAFVRGHRQAGVATALKHFPGHGSSAGDTHDGFVDVTEDWQEVELEPYRTMIADGLVDMVMVAHIYNGRHVRDASQQLPASLSRGWIEDVLRGDLGYDGVVISDDLEMAAIRAQFGLRETIERAVMAGNDILLFSNTAEYDPELGAQIQAIIVEMAAADPDFAARVAQSYNRIIALKRRMDIAR